MPIPIAIAVVIAAIAVVSLLVLRGKNGRNSRHDGVYDCPEIKHEV